MDKTMFDKCEWCNGGGKEPDGHYPCPDCEGTGMKGGRYAVQKFDEYIEEMEKINKNSGVVRENYLLKRLE